jgi:hypothetical protein
MFGITNIPSPSHELDRKEWLALKKGGQATDVTRSESDDGMGF